MGQVLRQKWRLDSLIGVGGMAAVYAATHRNGAHVAVKMLHSELSIDANVRGRFLREGYVANSVEHRGVVLVLDDDVADDGSVFLVMELLDGETLEGRRERLGGCLEPAEVLSLTDQLLDVLVAAHAKGIVHRDLKPENVFITVDGVVKVLDFGIAHVKQLSTASTATKAGTAMGTPAYMPPEQARGRWELVDAQSDVWAIGATMYTLLTGKLVHEAVTINEQLLAAMTTQVPSVGYHGSFASALVRVVDRALAFHKKDRWPDAAKMQEAVREAYHSIFRNPIGSVPKLSVPPSLRPPPARLIEDDDDPTRADQRALSEEDDATRIHQRGQTEVEDPTRARMPSYMQAARGGMVSPLATATDGAVAKGRTGIAFESSTWHRGPIVAAVSVGVVTIVLILVAVKVFTGGPSEVVVASPSGGNQANIAALGRKDGAASASTASADQNAVDIMSLPIATDSPPKGTAQATDAGKPAMVSVDAGKLGLPAPIDASKPKPANAHPGGTEGPVDMDKRK